MSSDNAPCPWIRPDRREHYSPWNLVAELVFIIPTFLAGTYGVFWVPVLGPGLAIVYTLWCFGCYFVVFRVVLCPNCYYYGRWCPDGMGKYAKKVFGVRGSVQNYKKALVIPTIGWAAISFFPPAVLAVALVFQPATTIIPVPFTGWAVPGFWYAIFFVALIVLYFFVHIRLSCRGCAHCGTCNLLKVFSFLKPRN
jgi:hypothetical protein